MFAQADIPMAPDRTGSKVITTTQSPHSERNTVDITRRARTVGAVIIAVGVTAAALTGCSSAGGGGTPSTDSKEYTLWDPYPDRDASSTWAKAIDACAADLGITIKRNAGNTGDTVKDLTTAAGNLPDIAMVDNP
jgi:multiple sugar transport system substrate-binding protein